LFDTATAYWRHFLQIRLTSRSNTRNLTEASPNSDTFHRMKIILHSFFKVFGFLLSVSNAGCRLKARISESQRVSIARQRLGSHGSVSLSGWKRNRFTRQRIRIHNRRYLASEVAAATKTVSYRRTEHVKWNPWRTFLLCRPTVGYNRPREVRTETHRPDENWEESRPEWRPDQWRTDKSWEQKEQAQSRTRRRNVTDDGLIRSHRLDDAVSQWLWLQL
jgi:hypothetical protein